jgi:photosystem II stability/assembly factor-like uncharacterized protein
VQFKPDFFAARHTYEAAGQQIRLRALSIAGTLIVPPPTQGGIAMTVCLSPNGPTVHQGDSAPTELAVATLDGAVVLKRNKGGAAWNVAERALEGLHIGSLLFEPRHGGLFAGVHDDRTYGGRTAGGLYYSPDGGATWERRTEGLRIEHVYSLAAVNAPEGVVVYAGTEPAALFESRDYGRTWQELPALQKVPGTDKWMFPAPPHIAHTKMLLCDEAKPRTIYAAIEQGALLKTEDGGRTWRELASYHKEDDFWYRDVHNVVPRPGHPGELYMTTGMGLYRSQDMGERWEQLTTRDFRIGYPDHLVFSPGDGRVMFMSGAQQDPSLWRNSHFADSTVLRSKDGGRTWEDANRGLPTKTRANIEAMCVAGYPSGYSLFAGDTDGQVFVSEDGGDSWTRIAAGLKPVSKSGHFRHLQDQPAAHA